MIELRNVSRRFRERGDVLALDRVDLQVPDGIIYGLIGSSGAGKSTLLRCINLLESPDEGEVLVDGTDIASLSRRDLSARRRTMGMVFQQFNLLESATVRDNIAMPMRLAGADRSAIDDRVAELLGFVGLTDKADVYPSRLSGGQKQRVGIARALANRPSILLCDEATSALDPQTTDSILALLRRINRDLGVTIVIVTHEMPVVASVCDRVAVMSHGRIVEEGPVIDVFAAPQQEITRGFVRTIIDDRVPSALVDGVRATREPYQLWRLTYTGAASAGTWLSDLGRRFDVSTSLLYGSVHEIASQVLGVLIVQALGEPEELERARRHLHEHGVDVVDQQLDELVDAEEQPSESDAEDDR